MHRRVRQTDAIGRHLFNADAVGIQRGNVHIIRGIKLGWKNIRQNLREQLGELASDAAKKDGIAGETDRETYPSRSLHCTAGY